MAKNAEEREGDGDGCTIFQRPELWEFAHAKDRTGCQAAKIRRSRVDCRAWSVAEIAVMLEMAKMMKWRNDSTMSWQHPRWATGRCKCGRGRRGGIRCHVRKIGPLNRTVAIGAPDPEGGKVADSDGRWPAGSSGKGLRAPRTCADFQWNHENFLESVIFGDGGGGASPSGNRVPLRTWTSIFYGDRMFMCEINSRYFVNACDVTPLFRSGPSPGPRH